MASAYQLITPASFQVTDSTCLAWNYDPVLAVNASTLPAAGTLTLARIPVRKTMQITNLVMIITVVGATLTSGQNFAALYQNGSLIGVTADQTATWGASTGPVSMALVGGPFTVTPGAIYVGAWYNGTTSPTLARSAGSSGISNAGFTVASNTGGRHVTSSTALTTTAPGTAGAFTAAANAFWWSVN